MVCGHRAWRALGSKAEKQAKSEGWELGTGPGLIIIDKGFGQNFSTTTMQKGVYAFIFNQKGLVGEIGLQGSKITKINPGK